MSRKFISYIILLAIGVVWIGLIIYFLSSYSYIKKVSLINLYDKNVTVTLADQTYTLQPFDTKLLEIKDLRNLNLTAKIDAKEIFSQNVTLPYSTQIIAAYFGDIQQCYYQTNLATTEANLEYTKLDMKNDLLIIDNLDANLNYFLPGSPVSTGELSKQTLGILPISCTDIDTKSTVAANNSLFLNYNAELQRQYYFQSIEKINNSTTVDQLGDVKGVQNDRLKYYYFGGKRFYFVE